MSSFVSDGGDEGDANLSQPRWSRRHGGNFLIFCTGARGHEVGDRDRARFVTAGFLMLLTTALAVYAGATVIALGFGSSILGCLPFGLIYGLFIFFIDRSVLLTIRPIEVVRTGKEGDNKDGKDNRGSKDDEGNETVSISRRSPGIGIRIVIAVCGALLIGETLLLRFFESSIAPKVQEIRAEQLDKHLATFDREVQVEGDRLQRDLDTKQTTLEAAQRTVNQKTDDVNCQLTGGSGACRPGPGAVYETKKRELDEANTAAAEAGRLRDEAQTTLDTFNRTRGADRKTFEKKQQATLEQANDLLIREEGFWRLTLEDHAVKLWRIIFSLLLLGIDLAPLIIKRRLDRSAYSRAERLWLWESEQNDDVEIHQIRRSTSARKRQVSMIANRIALVDVRRKLQPLRAEADEIRFEEECQAKADERRTVEMRLEHDYKMEEMRLEHERRMRELRNRFTIPEQLPKTRRTKPPFIESNGGGVTVAHPPIVIPKSRETDSGGGRIGPIPGRRDMPVAPQPDLTVPYDPTLDDDLHIGLTPGSGDDDVDEQILLRGQVLNGRWELERPFVQGGYGAVWLGRDREGSEPEIVVKLTAVHDKQAAAGEAQDLIRRLRHAWAREVEADEKLDSASAATRHIGKILDHGELAVGRRSFLFTVSPRYRPGSLADYCHATPERTLGWCLRIVDEILGAMVHAARDGLVHHDLKPANIVLDGDSARVIDWGLARFYQRVGSSTTGLVGGTLFYWSPEQARHDPGWDTPLTDLFSIGGILYFLVSDEAPLEGQMQGGANEALQYWRMVMGGVRPTPLNDRRLHRKLPREIAELADRWLAYDRADRVPPGTDPVKALVVAYDELRRVSELTRPHAGLVVGRPRGRR